jgi:hypothetical protein
MVSFHLRTLTVEEMEKALGPYVAGDDMRALLKRRDTLVAHFAAIAAERGEQHVFC